RDAVVPECGDEHEQSEGEEERQQRSHEGHLSSSCTARRRDAWASSSASSRGPGARFCGIASSTAWLILAISLKRILPDRNCATPTSLAALRTHGAPSPAANASRAIRRQGKRCSSGVSKSSLPAAARSRGEAPLGIR